MTDPRQLLLAVPIALAVACLGPAPRAPGTCEPTLESLERNVFRRTCAQQACHGPYRPSAGLVLTGDLLEVTLLTGTSVCDGSPLVVPGAPEASFLYAKVANHTACGEVMPPEGERLSDEELACVRRWIRDATPLDEPAGCETCGGEACVALATDPAHCGDCSIACPPGAACLQGACSCAGSLSACDDQCVDTLTSAGHCGGCGQPCGSSTSCSGGVCQCASGLTSCGGGCVDTESDPGHCGRCDAACTGQVCNAGRCSATCGAKTNCSGACVDTQTSPLHCGDCDRPCPTGATCVGGACACPAGTSSCGGVCLSTSSDPANCGGCGVTCAQGTVCSGGLCSCPGGGAVCGGACVDTQTSTAHCGGCGEACAPGQTCVAGACTCSSASVSFSRDVQPIFTASCATSGCHRASPGPNGGAKEGLDLTSGRAYAELVDVVAAQCTDGRKRVAPGTPSTSYLMDKLLGVDLCKGSQMPKQGVSLPSADLERISAWICNGAPNN